MKMNLDIPAVAECTIVDCAYNMEKTCHAKAITIGDADSPNCDTLCCGVSHVRDGATHAGVGACKVSSCSYNDDLECTAHSITVGVMNNHVSCLTYSLR